MNWRDVFQKLTAEEQKISEEIIMLMNLCKFEKVFVGRYAKHRRPEQPYMISFVGGNALYETTFDSIERVLKYARRQVVHQYDLTMAEAMESA